METDDVVSIGRVDEVLVLTKPMFDEKIKGHKCYQAIFSFAKEASTAE